MVSTAQTRMTAAEYLELPETNQPMQLLDGEVIVSPSPTTAHQAVVANVLVLLRERARVQGGEAFVSPLDVRLDEGNVVQPDVLYLAPESGCTVEDKFLSGAPDLIVEVLSPATARYDKLDKFRLYERYGVAEYWIADAQAQYLEVWQRREGKFALLGVYAPDEAFESSVVGAVEVARIFES